MSASANPFDEAFSRFAEPEPKVRAPEPDPVRARPAIPKITEPGAYADIPAEDYHGVEICDSPSISASGLKLIEDKSPLHYWERSPLNPNRRPRPSKPHFALGHLLHDILLYGGALPAEYHIVPDGFVRAHTNKWADEIEPYDEAVRDGLNILTESQFEMGRAMAESVDRHELAGALLSAGEPEMTLAAKDPKTGVWMRARPDVLPTTMEIIPDVKTAADASPEAFENAATRFGYFQAAAHYLDVIDLLYGEPAEKRRFVLIVIEKQPPHPVTIYHLDDGDIHYGRMLNRRSLNLFARCLQTNEWHGYSPPDRPILPLMMAPFARRRIDLRVESGDLSYDL